MAENTSNYNIRVEDMLEAGVHFGHLRSKWDPHMAPYIFMEKNGIHLVDLNKSARKLEQAARAMENLAASGKKILFVATKKQAKEIVSEAAKKVNMPFVTERWLGGMLTNYATVRKSIKKMATIDKMVADGTVLTLAKRERLMLAREREKLERLLGGIDENRLPAAIFIVDIKKEHIAVAEAKKLGIPSFAIVDTNANPNDVDYAIPGNDDATKSIAYITNVLTEAIQAGSNELRRKKESNKDAAPAEAAAEGEQA